ncbi:MAG: D-hexose-6-phosphate mutarotase, partial [Hyphomicrobium sp.]|nr:D-hexose-6-phosphate mutarotase [Hyphomicrobium sp.]
AVVALQGAQVLSWCAHGDAQDRLWLSPQAKLGTGKAVRGGIPVCWPWFGPHPTDTTKPAHGFVRSAPWTVAGSAASPARARLVLTFDTKDIAPELWAPRARAELEITVGETLSLALSTDNLSSAPFTLTQALHTYLAVGDIADVSVTGLEAARYVDQLDHGAVKHQSGAITIDCEVDRIYQACVNDVVVSDRNFGREIRVSKSGSQSTVIWNPWTLKAARLGDIGDTGHTRMLCVETANAGEDVVTLAPRARHRMETEISVQSIK